MSTPEIKARIRLPRWLRERLRNEARKARCDVNELVVRAVERDLQREEIPVKRRRRRRRRSG